MGYSRAKRDERGTVHRGAGHRKLSERREDRGTLRASTEEILTEFDQLLRRQQRGMTRVERWWPHEWAALEPRLVWVPNDPARAPRPLPDRRVSTKDRSRYGAPVPDRWARAIAGQVATRLAARVLDAASSASDEPGGRAAVVESVVAQWVARIAETDRGADRKVPLARLLPTGWLLRCDRAATVGDVLVDPVVVLVAASVAFDELDTTAGTDNAARILFEAAAQTLENRESA
ncbi:hypothetical protein [Nocardia bovistercoris]|uniref:Uncharacterized protein n=1 Tax=Nocardia bovistercoris TaxID=2785916 RepID=A0A931N8E8_9NOCA|nr:hypothetical protein [Nocardia bovistercoris]MBH0781703.1 hypothetical protein [Nocardia bovistercoris]